MSTILKALQKVEPKRSGSGLTGIELGQGDRDQPTLFETGQGNGEASDQGQNRRRLTKGSKLGFATALGILFLLVMGGAYYLTKDGQSNEKNAIKTFPIAKGPSDKDVMVNTPEVKSKGGVGTKPSIKRPSTDRAPIDKGINQDETSLVAAGKQQKDAGGLSVKGEAKGNKTPEMGNATLRNQTPHQNQAGSFPTGKNASVNTSKLGSNAEADAGQSTGSPSLDGAPIDQKKNRDEKPVVAAAQPQTDLGQSGVANETRGNKTPEETVAALKNKVSKKKNQERSSLNERKGSSSKPGEKKTQQWKNARRLKNDRMLLQALAWSASPAKRMGVIDGVVVREGDDVNGFTVVKIQKREMILSQNGQYFRLEFKQN